MRFSKFTGLNNVNAPEAVGDGGLTVALNVDVVDDGSLQSRDGTVLTSAGAAHSLWCAGDCIVFRRGSGLYRLNVPPDGEERLLASGLTGARRMSFARWGSRIYFSDGLHKGWTDGQSTAMPWGIARPDSLPTLSLETGTLPAGRYRYALTFMRLDGEESGPGAFGVVELNGQQAIAFTGLPLPGADVALKIIYLSTPHGELLYRHSQLPPDADACLLDGDGQAQGPMLAHEHREPPPAGQLVAVLGAHLIMADGPFLYYSGAYQPEHFDRVRQVVPFPGEIKLIAGLNDALIVGTDSAIYRLPGLNPDEWTLDTLATYGTASGEAVPVDGALIGKDGIPGTVVGFATREGFCVAGSGGAFVNLTQARYLPGDITSFSAAYLSRPGNHQLFMGFN